MDGARTLHALAPADVNGEVLVEVYDRGAGNDVRLKNVSARNEVTATDLLTAGFVINGNVPKRLLIRGIGPSLGDFGVASVLKDPVLRIYSGSTLVAENDNWAGTEALRLAFAEAGAFDLANLASADAALVVVLPPQAAGYTAQISSKDGSTGSALVEVYELP